MIKMLIILLMRGIQKLEQARSLDISPFARSISFAIISLTSIFKANSALEAIAFINH